MVSFISNLLVYNLFNSYLLTHREKIHEGEHRGWHQMWLVALLTCE